MNNLVVYGSIAADRPAQVLERIGQVKKKFVEYFLELCFLLGEVVENKYYEVWKFNSFKEYVENSGLDIQVGAAYRMVKLYEGAQKLGLTHEELAVAKPTKLLEIFSLNPLEHEKIIRKLLEEGDTNSVEEVRNKVKAEKGMSEDVFLKFKVEKEVHEDIILPALERCRQIHGSDKDKHGEVHDISDSKCLMLICMDFLGSSA
jgi:hypothetical protein